MKIIVGLGNPGKEYKGTRHNAGKFFLEKVAKKWEVELAEVGSGKHQVALAGKYGKGKSAAWLIFPSKFMNESGPALKKAFKELRLKPKKEDILVIHDELDIEVGKIKMTFAKSSAGHKGVDSVIKALKSEKFWRLRVGVQPKHSSRKTAKDFLLSSFTPAEKKLLEKNTKKILKGLEEWLKNQQKGMGVINQR